MKTKRLNRDGWGFQFFPYYQMRIDTDDFHGIACVIHLLDGGTQYWNTPLSGPVRVCGEGMTWMTLLPDNTEHIITAMYLPDNADLSERPHYPAFAGKKHPVSVWYVDVTEGYTYDSDGVIRYTDKYLDYIFTPEGDISVSDRDELDEAYASGAITKAQYRRALQEGKQIHATYCKNIPETEARFARIREHAETQIREGARPVFLYCGSPCRLETLTPESFVPATKDLPDITKTTPLYAVLSLRDALPHSLPAGADSSHAKEAPGDHYGLRPVCTDHDAQNPDTVGFVYRLSSESFSQTADGRWIPTETVTPLETIEIFQKD